ncbi:hypothetical protein [Amycolatopsis sp. NPDC003676]
MALLDCGGGAGVAWRGWSAVVRPGVVARSAEVARLGWATVA